jgi:uncharacterized protein
MRLGDEQESSNFEVQRGGGFGGFGGGGFPLPLLGLLLGSGRLGCGGIALLGLAFLAFSYFGGGLSGGGGSGGLLPGQQQAQTGQPGDAGGLTEVQHWSLRVLGSTERTWGSLFASRGQQYQPATLVFYDRSGTSGCGAAQSAMGPFYCPTDQKVYLDTSFFDELTRRFGAPGDFAQAYVIAHEIGHHVQDLTGTLGEANRAQQSVGTAEGNAIQVKVELQADCYAGVWAARNRALLEPGDVEEGLGAASAIGDDTLQREAQGRVVPESFTHGTSEQRMRWLKRGLDGGDPAQCDTFG